MNKQSLAVIYLRAWATILLQTVSSLTGWKTGTKIALPNG